MFALLLSFSSKAESDTRQGTEPAKQILSIGGLVSSEKDNLIKQYFFVEYKKLVIAHLSVIIVNSRTFWSVWVSANDLIEKRVNRSEERQEAFIHPIFLFAGA